jgi:hypothetical protein
MNAFSVIMKILAAAAVIAGIVFAVVVYGDKIMAFAKKLLSRIGCYGECDDSDFVDDCDLEDEDFVAGDQDFEG